MRMLEDSIFFQVYIAETKAIEQETIGLGHWQTVELFNCDHFLLSLQVLDCLIHHEMSPLDI